MKRAGNLLAQMVDRDNLREATHKALRGKRARREAIAFTSRLDDNLATLSEGLRQGTFPFGSFHQFIIHDPKKRLISAPCFAERVAHHAIMNVCEPILDRWLIDDTFACRVGRGRIAALRRTQANAHRSRYFLKLDIRKYFDSISHRQLLQRLSRRFKDKQVLDLFAKIVGSFCGPLARGLPIGSLMSQHFANFYLGWFDRFIKETLHLPGYVRYMDDMAIWNDDKNVLREVLKTSATWLADELDLSLKDYPFVNRTQGGMDFLGCRVFPGHMVLNRRSRVRYRAKLRWLEDQFQAGSLTELQLQQRATALTAFTRTEGVSSWRFRQAVLG